MLTKLKTYGLFPAAMAVALTFAVVSSAMAADLPAPKDIFAKFVKVSGGEAAYAKLKNRVTKQTLALPDMGMEGAMTETLAPPNVRRTIDFAGMGEADSGITDGVAWDNNPMAGASILEGAAADAAKRQAAFNPFLGWTDEGVDAKTVGEEKVGEEDCYKVDLTPEGGTTQTMFFNKESGLLVQVINEAQGQQMAMMMSDYKEVDGVQIAHKMSSEGGMMNVTITVDSVEHNVDLEDGAFALPDAIKALQGTDSAESAEPAEGSDSK